MALIFTFPCGGCGRRYTVYYPKALMYELSGSGTREMGVKEDEAERAAGNVEAARRRAEGQGNIWVDASERLELVCVCGKKLNFNIAQHPRVPQSKQAAQKRQTGLIPFPEMARPRHGPKSAP
ncbi:MAG: hypothetical protein QN183_01755 [Armatimonadota bacterium]|nr:hypothetical protein [Armatimonadota bacterium]MDR7486669.1 hypothetical protein [Armatimonadota bacterium]MDR7534677.1 hypothetical protein [Armatimonadota bacterium]MDR7535078.1 hypothetical protein [Armatimonadota bacterium]